VARQIGLMRDRAPANNWPLKNHHGSMRFSNGGTDTMQVEDLLKPEFWKQPWVALQNDFWVMLPVFAIVVVAVWWLRGWMSKREIGGLKGEISAKNGEISLLERQLKDAVAKSAASDTAMDEVEKRFKILEGAIAAKAENAALVALASQMQSAVGELVARQAAVSNAVGHRPWIDDIGPGLQGAGRSFGAGAFE